MKYIINTVTGLLAYHFIVCLVASFARWENMLFNLDEWAVPGRFFYLLGFMLIAFFCVALTNENKEANNEQT